MKGEFKMNWLELYCKIEVILTLIGIGIVILIPILFIFANIGKVATKMANKYIDILYESKEEK